MENYQLGSADGVSLAFIIVWFIGDLANFFGAVWAGLVPTVIALAVYFIIADAVLLTQCLYYKRVNARQNLTADLTQSDADNPEQPLLGRRPSDIGLPGSRRRSSVSIKRRDSSLPTPVLSTIPEEESYVRPWVKNAICVVAVCAIGTAGWAIAWKAHLWVATPEDSGADDMGKNVGAEILGYLSALLYLGYDALSNVSTIQRRCSKCETVLGSLRL